MAVHHRSVVPSGVASFRELASCPESPSSRTGAAGGVGVQPVWVWVVLGGGQDVWVPMANDNTGG